MSGARWSVLCSAAIATACATPADRVGSGVGSAPPSARCRPADLGIHIGELAAGPYDAITDVGDVRVGHSTLRIGDTIRTGVTVVVPHGGNLFRRKVPAAIVTANGFGKLVGSTQVDELGEIESPIALTNTLNVGIVMDELVGWSLAQPGNERVRSVNVVVGETNDGRLNDIRGRHVRGEHVVAALAAAQGGPVEGGAVGAGTGTVCFGYKGGIGTSSRRVGEFTVGVLVQTNFGGRLRIEGREVARETVAAAAERGSCMIVIATDAPLDARNLRRLAARSFAGMARAGASFSNGSGDYAIAFGTSAPARAPLANDAMSPLFVAVADATEQAILDSILRAETTTGNGATVHALPIEAVRRALDP